MGARGGLARAALGALLLAGCARPVTLPTRAVEAPARPREVWVDASAKPGGDGSLERPLAAVPPLDAGVHLRLRSGLYAGPFRFPGGTVVTGHGVAVLYVEGRDTVVTTQGGLVRLERLLVQGGGTGVSVSGGELSLEGVKFSGHAVAALDAVGASVEGAKVEVTGGIPGVTGFRVRGGRLELREARLAGPMRAGVEARGAAVQLEAFTSEGPATGAAVVGGALEGATLRLAGGQGAALSVHDAGVTLRDVDVTGHEYALLGDGEVTLDGLVSRGAQYGGVSLVAGTSTLRRVKVERAGGMGGVQLLGGRHTLEGVEVSRSGGWGVMVRKAEATIGMLRVASLRGEQAPAGRILGDGLVVRDARVHVTTLVADDLEGSALFASNEGTATVGSLEARRCGGGAVFLERRSAATVDRLVSRSAAGPSVVVLEAAHLVVRDFSATGGDVSVWADCADGARVDITRHEPETVLPALRCLFVPPVSR
ncbi:MAG: hypothetical protein INH41_24585 [Myxococcaceae bacterium]|nr:hypothetical protein [Myxococcaceae bacterium]MCA3015579.1 hypothetical protein [Myxococcaceae bacterium]